MKISRLPLALVAAALFFIPLAQADIVHKQVPASGTGLASSGATIVAGEGSVVYARSGSNVQYWPGSTLVPKSQFAAKALPDCASASTTAEGSDEELAVASGGKACTSGDVAVIAHYGSTVVYDDDVALIRRPVVKR